MHPDTRIHVTLEHLRALEGQARGLSFLPHQPAASALTGRHASRLRGRGLNFEELRGYLPGDDIRSIDWKVTARTGEPHVRVFTEERDRPALLVVDQRMSMFFGSRLNMKSVTAAEAATIAGFSILSQGDRVGSIVFDDERELSVQPRRSSASLFRILKNIADMNCGLHAEKQVTPSSHWLNRVLGKVANIASHDHLVVIFSDFVGIDDTTQKRLSGIAAHNDVILMLVYDPAARVLGQDGRIVLGDGTMQAEIDLGDRSVYESLSEYSNRRLERIFDWQKSINLSVLPLDCGEESLPQVRRLMASLAPRRRQR